MIPSQCLFALVISIAGSTAFAGAADQPATPVPEPGAFSWSHLNPPELQFGCFGLFNDDEERLAKLLATSNGDEQLAAARALWKGRSRRNATAVLKYLAGPPPGGDGFRAFQREVDAALQPEAIRRELQKGDYLWGTWLAFLRPHKDIVPALLAGLKNKPEERRDTLLALGNSGDPRALAPLLKALAGKDVVRATFAARALGYLGDPGAEEKLIEAIGSKSPWVHADAADALGKVGTRKALPALEKFVRSGPFNLIVNTEAVAADAIKSIEKRHKP